MSRPFDTTLKQLLDDYGPDWGAWLAGLFGYPPGPVVTLNPELDTVQMAADRVFRLPGDTGLLHLEVQSSWDGDLPGRMLAYNVYLDRRENRPVHSVAILLRRDANATSLDGHLVRRRGDGRASIEFHYDVIRVWELHADDLLAGGLGTAALGFLTDDAEDRLPALVHDFAGRVGREVADVQTQSQLLASSSLLLGLRYDEQRVADVFMGVQKMQESSVYRALIAEGVAQGRVEGRVEGRLEELHLTLITLIEAKFGGIAAELEARIRRTTDADVLRAAVRRVLTAASAADLVL